MANRSVVPAILSVLEPWLDARDAEWKSSGVPTLPVTRDGKVNVRQMTLALGLRENQEQHFYRHPALYDLVNRIAAVQGLKGVKSRIDQDEDDKIIASRLARSDKEQGDLARMLAEREAMIEAMRRRISELEAQLELRAETGMICRTGDVR